jgi:mRNA-degrading endonuclease toxin of MazEF toxin-antitoxin module
MPAPVRGGVYQYRGDLRRTRQLVISLDTLNRLGTVVVVEVVDDNPPEDLKSLLAVQLGPGDPAPGGWVLCWRLNYVRADRLEVETVEGRVGDETMERVVGAIRAVIEP